MHSGLHFHGCKHPSYVPSRFQEADVQGAISLTPWLLQTVEPESREGKLLVAGEAARKRAGLDRRNGFGHGSGASPEVRYASDLSDLKTRQITVWGLE